MKYILKETDENDLFSSHFVISHNKLEKIDLVKIPKSLSRAEKITSNEIPYQIGMEIYKDK